MEAGHEFNFQRGGPAALIAIFHFLQQVIPVLGRRLGLFFPVVLAQNPKLPHDALLRHAFAWWEGEDIDPDSGLSHITKAIATLVVLRDAMLQNMCTDDRPPPAAAFYGDLNVKAAEILDRHADKNPTHYTKG